MADKVNHIANFGSSVDIYRELLCRQHQVRVFYAFKAISYVNFEL